MATDAAVSGETRARGLAPVATVLAVLIHAGLLAVCFTAVYLTPENRADPPPCPVRHQALLGLLALGLLIPLVATKGRAAGGLGGKLCLGLGLGIVYSLRLDPIVLGDALPESMLSLDHSLADVVVPLLGLLCLAWVFVSPAERSPEARPVQWPLLLAGVAIVALGVGLRGLSGLRHPEVDWWAYTPLAQRTVSFMILLAVCWRVSGARGFGWVPHLYVAATLLAVVARARVL